MSHELRTPLNSILILGQQLADNPGGNLSPKQVEFARNIHSAGSDLLTLINDILDLSKIESGTVTVEVEEVPFAALRESLERNFRHVAESKNLAFLIDFDPGLPRHFTTDPKRLQQILKNLLSNAFKFTGHGQVTVHGRVVDPGLEPGPPRARARRQGAHAGRPRYGYRHRAGEAEDHLRGLPTGRRRHGPQVRRHRPGAGHQPRTGDAAGRRNPPGQRPRPGQHLHAVSAVELHRPGLCRHRARQQRSSPAPAARVLPVLPVAREESIPDDREAITKEDTSLLIVEDDPHYARVLLGLARDKGFKAIVAMRGSQALILAREYQPTAITLDIFLPDMLGWTVLNNLKLDPHTRHIPVQIISLEGERRHGLAHGAFNYLVKPVTTQALEECFDKIKAFALPHTKRLLVVEDDPVERQGVVELLSHTDIEITAVGTGQEALTALLDRPFDCCVLDLRLPDMSGFELLDKVQAEPALRDVPVVVFTGKELTDEEEAQLKAMAKSVVLKDVQSPERLFDETALFLHRVVADLPKAKQELLEKLHNSNEALHNRKVLVVDDDARNIFALATLLENHEMEVLTATNGRQAIDLIHTTPDLNVVLMDIMMPEMDGYETMREIRKEPRFRALPILALTAKAMKGDREKCLEAGASDYIAKPVNTEQLLSLLRVWLYR